MREKQLKQIVKNCDQRIRSAKSCINSCLEHCVYTQNQALNTIEQNESLKRKCLDRLVA